MLGAILLVIVVYLAARFWRIALARRRPVRKRQGILHEFWIWTPEEALPPQPQIQRRLNQGNPHNQGRILAVTQGDMLRWWGDVRLHVGMSLRSKNPHIFEPRFFSDESEIPEEAERAMATAKGLITVRFTTDDPMPNRDYLHFLTHLTDSIADLSKAELIYDREGMRFWPGMRWKTGMMRDNARQDFDKLVWVHAVEEPSGWWLHTHGLRKYGLPDLEMTEVATIQRTVCTDILRDLAQGAIEHPDDALSDGTIQAYGRDHHFVLIPSDRDRKHHRGLVLNVVDTTSIIDQIVYER